VLIIRRSNCINTASDIAFSGSDRPAVGQSLTIPDVVLTQFDLMMSTELLETCRGS